MRFPQEIWEIITDLKRHKDVRRGLEVILANVVISRTPIEGVRIEDAIYFKNGTHFRLYRFTYKPLMTVFQASGDNFFPYNSSTNEFTHTIGNSEFFTEPGFLFVSQ